MTDESKEPMISKGNRPTPIDYDAPISDWQIRDLVALIDAKIEVLKPEKELSKPEKEYHKPERYKPEQLKPEKESLKGEKEYSKPEKEFEIEELLDRFTQRFVDVLKEYGVIKER